MPIQASAFITLFKVSTDKASQAFRSNRLEFESFLHEMIRWFSDRQQEVDELFSHSDTDRSGSVNLKDFELGNPSSLHRHLQSLNKLWGMCSPALLVRLWETIIVFSVIPLLLG